MQSPQLAPPIRHTQLPSLRLLREDVTLGGLFAAQPLERLETGEAVFWEGDAASHVFQIAEGCLRLYRILPDGRRAVVGFAFGGEVLGVSCPGFYLYTAEAVTKVRLRRLPRSRFHSAVDGSADLRPQLLARMCEEMEAIQRHVIMLGQLNAEERVASFLVSAARRSGADKRRPAAIELPMSRQDIADYLGLTIETVCRVISKFKRDRLIALEGRHMVVSQCLSGLQELAGGMDEDDELSHSRTSVARSTKWSN